MSANERAIRRWAKIREKRKYKKQLVDMLRSASMGRIYRFD